MVSCSACGCSKTPKTTSQRITFHRFPRDERKLNAWLKIITKEDWKPMKNSVLCSLHFSPESFDRSSNLKVRLQLSAIPTIVVERLKYVRHFTEVIIKPMQKVQEEPTVVASTSGLSTAESPDVLRNIPTNTDIKMDPSICSNFPKGVASSKMGNSFNSDLQIKEEQNVEDEAHLVEASCISDANQVSFKCEINEEINLEQEELTIKDEPEEVEELGLLEIIKYNTNPPTLGIRDRAANTEIKIDPSITRVDELLQICTCDVQVIRVSEQVFKSKMERYLNFNLQDNTGQQFEVEDCTVHQLPTSDFECKVCSLCVPQSLFKQHMLKHKDAKHKRGKRRQKSKSLQTNSHP